MLIALETQKIRQFPSVSTRSLLELGKASFGSCKVFNTFKPMLESLSLVYLYFNLIIIRCKSFALITNPARQDICLILALRACIRSFALTAIVLAVSTFVFILVVVKPRETIVANVILLTKFTVVDVALRLFLALHCISNRFGLACLVIVAAERGIEWWFFGIIIRV